MAGGAPEADTGSLPPTGSSNNNNDNNNDDDDDMDGSPPRRWGRILGLVALLVLIWLGIATWMLVSAAGEVRSARDDLETIRDAEPADLLEGDLDQRLHRAAEHLDTAQARTGSPVVAPLRILPFVGRQVRSADALASAGSRALAVASSALTDTRALLDGPLQQGADRVRVLDELHAVATKARSDLGTPDLGPTDHLVGPLQDARVDLARELDRVTVVLDRAIVTTAGLTDLLQGPHHYLLVAANNAEMRAGSGFFGSMGVLSTQNGSLQVSAVQAAPAVKPPDGAVVPTGDMADRWDWLRPADDFRNLGVTPRFAETAQLAAAMWVAGGHDPVDGVIAVDPVFLQGLLKATGPVVVDGITFSADEVIAYLLNGQYDEITDFEAGSNYDARKNYLSLVTAQIMASINGAGLDAPDLVDGVRDAARGRHLLAWSSVPAHQAAFEATSVDGAMTERSLMVSIVNRGAVKLDWYIDVDADLRLTPDTASDTTTVELDVQVRNEAPEQASPYVVGPNPFLDIDLDHEIEEAEYVGVLAVTIPGAATGVSLEGTGMLETSGPDGPTQVVMGMVDVPRRTTQHYVVRFTLPGADASLRVEPDARYPVIDWDVDGRTSSDGQGHTVTARGGTTPQA